MKKRLKMAEPLCQTSEKEPEILSRDELAHIKSDIGKRIVEAFNYHPDAEIAYLLKTSCQTIKAFTEGEEFPPVEILLSIHKATGVSLHWLLTGEGTKRPSIEMPLVVAEESAICGLA
jgi:transcriptional regulator with XRE-family HTH domain